MPILPISDGHGSLTEHLSLVLLPFMIFPDEKDEEKREIYFYSILARYVKEIANFSGDETPKIPIIALDWLINGNIADVEKEAVNTCTARFAAGDTLLSVLNQHLDDRAAESASIGRAQHLVAWQYTKIASAASKAVPSSEGMITAAWSRFKPAAHLWAAFRVLAYDMQEPQNDLHEQLKAVTENPVDLLVTAEGIRLIAERLKIVGPEIMWRVPEDISLPDCTIHVPPMPEGAISALAEYKPRSRGN